jgi:hypothetical protein
MSILNSYKIYKGTETTISENGSPDGVIMAANISTTQIACLLKDFRTFLDNTPNADRTATTVGNSKTIPNVSTIDVNIAIYEVNENVFSTSGLT